MMRPLLAALGLAGLLPLVPVSPGRVLERSAVKPAPPPPRIQARLAYRAARPDNLPPALPESQGGWAARSTRPLEGFTLPPLSGNATRVLLQLRGDGPLVVGAVGRSAEHPGGESLWLDWNGDRFFAPEERVVSSYTVEGTLFGPIMPRQTTGQPQVPFSLCARGDKMSVRPSGWLEGEVLLAGRRVRLGLLDLDLDGRFDDAVRPGPPFGVMLLVDWNGDNRFAPISTEGLPQSFDAEAVPLGSLVQMPDGLLYRAEASPDGTQLTLERPPLVEGKVQLPSSRFVLGLAREGSPLWVRGVAGSALLPAGSYDVMWATLGMAAKDGRVWRAPVITGEGPGRGLLVPPAGTTALQCGVPFRVDLRTTAEGRALTFELALQDRAGNPVLLVSGPSGQRAPEPVLRIWDGGGKLVKTEKFHYG